MSAPEPDHAEAVANLRAADPVMADIIERVGPCMLGSRTDRGGPAHDHYGALLRAIVGQQLSVSAAPVPNVRLSPKARITASGGRRPTFGSLPHAATSSASAIRTALMASL